MWKKNRNTVLFGLNVNVNTQQQRRNVNFAACPSIHVKQDSARSSPSKGGSVLSNGIAKIKDNQMTGVCMRCPNAQRHKDLRSTRY